MSKKFSSGTKTTSKQTNKTMQSSLQAGIHVILVHKHGAVVYSVALDSVFKTIMAAKDTCFSKVPRSFKLKYFY